MSPAIGEDRGTYDLLVIPRLCVGIPQAWIHSQERKTLTMTKTLDVITEIIRNPKHPFRKVDDRPVKAQKHRYERRKVKEFIRLGDWAQEKMIV
jgi:hypothetical protein